MGILVTLVPVEFAWMAFQALLDCKDHKAGRVTPEMSAFPNVALLAHLAALGL